VKIMKSPLSITILGLAALALSLAPASATAYDFSYEYGHPQTPLDDGFIVSSNNAVVYSEATVRAWKPDVGGSALGSTTPGEVIYHFSFAALTSEIVLWMNMPTFHWSYSQGHNYLWGSTDGSTWISLADLPPPAFGSARDLGTVPIPSELIGAGDLWLRVHLYSYGTSAPQGGVWTNTAQLSRYDINAQNTSFRLNVNYVPEPGTGLLMGMGMVALTATMRRSSRPSKGSLR
jgi:hypothetical protein